MEAYSEALGIAPDEATNGEAAFWTGISLIAAGQVEEGIPYLRRAQAVHPRWAELVERLPTVALLPEDPALIARLVREMRRGRQ